MIFRPAIDQDVCFLIWIRKSSLKAAKRGRVRSRASSAIELSGVPDSCFKSIVIVFKVGYFP